MDVDVLVIGAGAGGLLTAARLAHLGYRTLVAERLDYLGGRASTRDVDGFKVNNGAIVIETGGITERTFAEVGAGFDVRVPDPPILYRIGGQDVDVTGGGWARRPGSPAPAPGCWPGWPRRAGTKGCPPASCRPRTGCPGSPGTSPCTASSAACAGRCSRSARTSSPARVFLTYFTRKSAFKTFGFCPRGTVGIWESLAAAIVAAGGQVWLGSEVRSLTMADGLVTGAVIARAVASGPRLPPRW